ncbi:MAG: Hsp33 family molecular chaperone HslO [Burkholderiales bacterium]|nr:Hsp33 family molecular chaperone HslO [Burkholderiales bacterium]
MPSPVPADLTQRFLLENLDIRGQVVRLGPLWRTILGRRDYPEAIRPLLADFAAIGVLIGAGLKHPGRAVLQVMGHGPVQMAVADCSRELALRAMVRLGEGYDAARHATLPQLFADGRLALTLENAATARQFQSIVPLEGATLAECFERYFDVSEQVPTHLWVHATDREVGALILQKLPRADERDPNGWARIQHLAATADPSLPGLMETGPLLAHLFPEDDVRLYEPQAVTDGCGRSEEKVVAMLRGLGRAEVEATLAEHGVVAVRDEICNQDYRFTPADVARIFEG